MKYTVCLLKGDYDDYAPSSYLEGEVDPVPLLNEFVNKESGGLWRDACNEGNWMTLLKGTPFGHILNGRSNWQAHDEKCAELERIRARLAEPLLAAGFKTVVVTEVWLGSNFAS